MSIYSDSSLSDIKGVGGVFSQKLQAAGLNSKFDLINFFPRAYQDIKFTQHLANVKPGQISVKARAENVKLKRTNRVVTLLTADLVDDSSKIMALWFNQPYRANQLKAGEFYFTGKFELSRGRYQLINPSVQQVSTSNFHLSRDRLQPIYSQVRGLKTSFFDKIIVDLKDEILTLNESLPEIVVDKLAIMARSDAIYELHFPSSMERVSEAKWRLQVEEAFIAQLASYQNGRSQIELAAQPIEFDQELARDFVMSLPFNLTTDQRKSSWRIIQSIAQPHPMNLLLQGDVGSGKTIVAEMACLQVAHSGFQAAFLAPTEVLAQQHFQKISKDLAKFDIKVGLLTSSIKGQARSDLYQQIKDNQVNVVIGTHALIQDAVEFAELSLVVIDEQHRFGVKQRQQLLAKAKLMPHLLSMTATPIPRTLALTIKKELEISSIREKPAARLPIITEIYYTKNRDLVYDKIKQELMAGRQGFIVCGRIEDNEEEQLESVEVIYKKLSKSEFKDYRLAMLHGKMKSSQKIEIMNKFLNHEIDLLVATTVIEVGVDVPNATAMMIEDADNYGLSQLHQLRGRVGRSRFQSYCFLITSNEEPNQRLQAIAQSEDGFYLSEVDLKLRGMGSVYGQQQHGWFSLEADLESIKTAQAGIDFYLEWLKEQKLSLAEHLNTLPELKERLNQFDQVTVLN